MENETYNYDISKIHSNISFKRTWYIYEIIDNEKINLPFINRGRKWIHLSDKLAQNNYYYKEVELLKKKYNFTI